MYKEHNPLYTILVPGAAILLASATDRELWQGPKAGCPRITDVRLSAQPQKFETITVTIGYKNGQLLRLRVILASTRAIDPWRLPKGSQKRILYMYKNAVIVTVRLYSVQLSLLLARAKLIMYNYLVT